MNIEDFTPRNYTWPEIFQLQKQLHLQYEPELQDRIANFDINIFEDQELFRHMAWRITEELMEAQEAYKLGDTQHLKEELIDAFNFLIELYQLMGMGYGLDFMWEEPSRDYSYGSVGNQIYHMVYHLGMAANKLKSRRWRQSQYVVNLHDFQPLLIKMWNLFILIFDNLGMTAQDVRYLWSQKYQVNLFRLQSKY